MRSRAHLGAATMLVATVVATVVAAAEPAVPASGRYDAQLCVATTTAGATCGPAEVVLRAMASGKGPSRARVRIADIVYDLTLHSSQVDVVLMHGAMQLDEFTADYEWVGGALQFTDTQKAARYEVRLGPRSGDPQAR